MERVGARVFGPTLLGKLVTDTFPVRLQYFFEGKLIISADFSSCPKEYSEKISDDNIGFFL